MQPITRCLYIGKYTLPPRERILADVIAGESLKRGRRKRRELERKRKQKEK
jgi:hypothetical protein